MRILLSSYHFSPDVGGIETASALLATEFAAMGHETRVITHTRENDDIAWPFSIIRALTASQLIAEVRWCDVFFQNNISIQSLWAALLLRKPWVVAHQTWISNMEGTRGWRDRLKRFALPFGTNVAISQAIASDLGVQSTLIPNPYREDLFKLLPSVLRDRDLVYLGRLVSDKGVDLLLEALTSLQSQDLSPNLTIVGTGPEEDSLRQQAARLGLAGSVHFAGALRGTALAETLNRHRILVAPSRWAEPFGIVALEGMACGCVVIGSDQGGLPEAIGPCGLTFPNGDAPALAAALRRALTEPELIARCRSGAEAHLARHTAKAIARAYLEVFERALQ